MVHYMLTIASNPRENQRFEITVGKQRLEREDVCRDRKGQQLLKESLRGPVLSFNSSFLLKPRGTRWKSHLLPLLSASENRGGSRQSGPGWGRFPAGVCTTSASSHLPPAPSVAGQPRPALQRPVQPQLSAPGARTAARGRRSTRPPRALQPRHLGPR